MKKILEGYTHQLCADCLEAKPHKQFNYSFITCDSCIEDSEKGEKQGDHNESNGLLSK